MKRSPLIIVQSVLCALSAITLIAAVLMIYIEGSAAKSADPMANVYSVDAIADKAVFVLPVLAASIIVTIICAIAKVKAPGSNRAIGKILIRNNSEDGRISPTSVNLIRCVILLIAVIFIIIGIFNGSLKDVFIKASNICTGCLGLG